MDDAVSALGRAQQTAGPVPGGGQRAPGAGRADGGVVGATGGRDRDGTPRFDQAVGPGAYLWWYIDAISDDGQHALSLIAFVGSVFSPYYAAAFKRQGAQVNPENHCALNVALYGAAGQRWTMTERGARHVHRDRSQFNIGPSSLQWRGDHLQIDINEVAMPLPRRVRGRIRVFPQALCTYNAALDDQGRHRWGPIAPCARIEVAMDSPAASWKGQAYVDSNEGDEPVSGPFKVWDWSRAAMADGSTAVIYDVQLQNGNNRLLAERFKPNGEIEAFEAAPRQALPTTLWRVGRSMRSEDPSKLAPTIKETLEDTPFYARSLVNATLLGERVVAVHETLQPQRLKAWPMPLMLPFRMPRRA